MNKELTPLEALERIGKEDLHSEREDYCFLKNVYVNEYNIIEKSLKALEIIKMFFNKYDFELVNSYEDGKPVYLLRLGTKNRKWVFILILEKEEYDLLKEVLV